MPDKIIINSKQILESAKNILLVDWPNPGVPRILVDAGFTVFCYSPNGYTKAELLNEYTSDVKQKNIFPPKDGERGYLIFRPLDSAPESIDIVNIYRPEEEHAEIILKQALPLHAKCIWLQPPAASVKTRSLANEYGLIFIEGDDITEIAGQ